MCTVKLSKYFFQVLLALWSVAYASPDAEAEAEAEAEASALFSSYYGAYDPYHLAAYRYAGYHYNPYYHSGYYNPYAYNPYTYPGYYPGYPAGKLIIMSPSDSDNFPPKN